MKDVELVIKIPERMYKEIMAMQHSSNLRLIKAIRTGTPLPKGHGEIVDVDAVIEWLKDKDIIKMSYQENNAREDMLKSAPTIIQADKEESEE